VSTDPLVTANAIAALLLLSRSQVYALAREGKIPCYRPGGALRFRPEEVLAAIRQQPS